MSVYFRDVTEARRADEAVRAAERQLRLVTDALPAMIGYVDAGQRYRFNNAAYLEWFGIGPEEMAGRHLREVLGEEAYRQRLPYVERALRGETVRFDGESRHRARGSVASDLQYVPDVGEDGRVRGFVVLVQDISRRAREQQELRAAKEHAEQSAGRWRAVVGSMAEGVVVGDAAGNLPEWNAAALEMHGYASLDEVRRHLNDFPEVLELTTAEGRVVPLAEWPVSRVLRGESFSGYELTIRRLDAELRREISYSGSPVRDGDGRVVLAVLTLHDVTERRRAEEQLRRSHDTFYHLIQNDPFGVYVVDADFRLREASLGSQKVFARVPRPLIGRDFGEVLRAVWAEPFASQAIAVFRHTLETGEPYASPATIERRAGEARVEAYDWRIERITLPDGRPGVVCYFYDLSERQRWEAALREGEARLQLALAIAEMGTFEIDLASDAVTVNDAGRVIYGWAPGEALTFSKVQTHFHPEDREWVVARVGEALRPGGPGEFEVEQRIVRTDGATRWIRVRGRAVFEDVKGERRAVRCVGTYLDITPQREEAERREQLLVAERGARDEAERASRMKDEFLATLSHELRTPLNAILGWAQILRQGGGVQDARDLSDGLAVIERNARAQTQIIEDLLDMSRIVSGKVRLDVRRLDPAEVVRGAVETVRPAAEAKGVRVQAVLDPSAGPVSGDPGRLQQVFWNLLNNAVKFTPRGGRVQVVLGRVNSHVEVSVADSGEGIAPEFLPYVFDRFRQADASTTRRHGGLGLGLAIVRQLVELHGGGVRAESAGLGRGATFILTLPLTPVDVREGSAGDRRHPTAADGGVGAAAADAPGATGLADACIRIEGVRVLVVDDEPDARGVVERVLRDCGAAVATAASAREALERLEGERFDVLVSDIGMPGEDGYALIRRVRGLGVERGGAIPAVALTAYARAEDRMKAVLAGFQMHVAKPVEPAELVTMVASLAGRVG